MMSWLKPFTHPMQTWQNLLPCLLCGQQRGQIGRVCQECFSQLPWKKTWLHRHDIDCFACCYYDFPIRNALTQFKDHAQFQYIPLLTACLLSLPKPRVQAIVPMPISTEKLIRRGYNQTDVLATQLSRYWQIPVWRPIEHLPSHSQRGLSRAERLHNLKNKLRPVTPVCRYKHVLLLDDVITTGSSLYALHSALSDLGCTRLQSLVLCDAKH